MIRTTQEGMTDEEHDPLIMRIQSGIDYTREQLRNGKVVMQAMRFRIRMSSPSSPYSSKALKLLRQAHQSGYANQIYASLTHECYELGIQRPDWVSEGATAVSRIHDPQWWVGKSAAAIKAQAAPDTDADDDKKTAEILTRKAKMEQNRIIKNKRRIEIDQKLAEGLRRQRLGLKMYNGITSEDFDTESEDEDADKPEILKKICGVYRNDRAPADNSKSDYTSSRPQRKCMKLATAFSPVSRQVSSGSGKNSRDKEPGVYSVRSSVIKKSLPHSTSRTVRTTHVPSPRLLKPNKKAKSMGGGTKVMSKSSRRSKRKDVATNMR